MTEKERRVLDAVKVYVTASEGPDYVSMRLWDELRAAVNALESKHEYLLTDEYFEDNGWEGPACRYSDLRCVAAHALDAMAGELEKAGMVIAAVLVRARAKTERGN